MRHVALKCKAQRFQSLALFVCRNFHTDQRLDAITIELGAANSFRRAGAAEARAVISRAVPRSRGWDDGFAFALFATGRVDAAVQAGLSRWDISAFVPIIHEAGGRVTDWNGDSVVDGNGCVLAAGPGLHGRLRAELPSA